MESASINAVIYKNRKYYSPKFLGEFLRTFDSCEYQESDYGIYITGFDDMEEDLDNQYWWCISVNRKAVV